MSLHSVIGFVLSLLGSLAQLKFQSKSSSPFDSQPWLMSSFFVALFTYVVWWTRASMMDQAQNQNNHDKVSLILGALASILLLLVVFPVLGWVTLFVWIICFLKTVYQLVKHEFLQLVDQLNEAIHGQFNIEGEDLELPV